MPDITITEDQRDRLEDIRGDIEAAFVDDYGYTRLEDAVEYLLDTYTPPNGHKGSDSNALERIATAEYPQLQQIAAEVPEVPGSGIDADEMRGKLLAELGGEAFAERLAALDDAADGERTGDDPEGPNGPADDEESVVASAATTQEEDATETPDATAETADPSDTEPSTTIGVSDTDTSPDSSDEGRAATDGETGGEGTTETASTGGPGEGGVLSAANRLLAEHDDKWRESDAGDEPYEVDLPDGSTESARTKDDVRQLLFRHY